MVVRYHIERQIKLPTNLRAESVIVSQLAFPQNKSRPIEPAELAKMFSVSRSISRNLVLPVIQARLWHPSEATSVPVPKTTIHEDHFLSWSKNQIRLAWQILPVKPVSVSQVIDKMTHNPFWLSVIGTD